MLKHNYSFEALGTQWSIESSVAMSVLLKAMIQDRIETFDSTYSRFRKDSLVNRIAHKAGEYTFPPDAQKLFDFYKDLYGRTDGKVTPLIGDALVRAGYDAQYSFEQHPQAEVPGWVEAMEWSGTDLVTTQPVTIDVGAAGKGYLVDMIGSLLDEHSIDEYVIDASGDLKHKGSSKNIVGLEHPRDPTKVIGTVNVQNKSLCASASNRRKWGEGMHHIFDPDTIAPTRDIIASWVIADDTLTADGLATALFFVGPEELYEQYEFQYVRMHADGAIDYSSHFEGELF